MRYSCRRGILGAWRGLGAALLREGMQVWGTRVIKIFDVVMVVLIVKKSLRVVVRFPWSGRTPQRVKGCLGVFDPAFVARYHSRHKKVCKTSTETSSFLMMAALESLLAIN